MAVRRRFNFLSQSRVDTPHMRSVESATSNDFDELIAGLVTGTGNGYILRGFEVSMSGAIGGSASGLQLLVDSGCIFHSSSKESGTFFLVPSGTTPEILNSTINTKVVGAFTPNAVNYVGIEYQRAVDDSTTDQVYFWDPTNKNETSKTVPLAKTLNYTIVITTSLWASNVLPVAKVTTDVANNVVDVTDDRDMLFRLGKGGRSTPNPSYEYPWTNQSEGRAENSPTSTSNAVNPFRGGDKMIYNMKEWMDAVMTMFKELKGTTFWYSENIGGSLVSLREDLGNTVFTGRGDIAHDKTVPGRINWSDDIYIKVVGSRLSYKIISNPSPNSYVTLSDDQVAYIKLVRGQAIIPNLIWTTGSQIVASVGAVSWTSGLVAGDWVKLSTDDDTKYYQIQSVDSLSQVTMTSSFTGTSTGPSGSKSQYAFGVYQSVAIPSTDRHVKIASRANVPFNEDTFWILLRSDNSGLSPRVYARFIAAELKQGESREINDETSEQLIKYIGAKDEADDAPEYSTKMGALTSEITDLTFTGAAAISGGQYLLMNGGGDIAKYYVWFRKDSIGSDPTPVGRTGIVVDVYTGDTGPQVATAFQTAVNLAAASQFSVSALGSQATVTNVVAGDTTDATNVNVGGLTISVSTQGTGVPNFFVIDGDDLTLSIKRLDDVLNAFTQEDKNDYEEAILVVSGSPSGPTEVTGPVLSGSTLTIPPDSRNGNLTKYYVVGMGMLQVFLNGQRLDDTQWSEIGTMGSQSNTITININLLIDDELIFRIDPSLVVGGTSGGEANTGSNLGTGAAVYKNKTGVSLNFRRLKQGTGVTITENTDDITIASAATAPLLNVVTVSGSNYGASVNDDFILVSCLGADRTVTLPTAIGNSGKEIALKLVDSGNSLYVKTVLSQTIDGVDATATPLQISVQYETVTLVSDNSSWWVK